MQDSNRRKFLKATALTSVTLAATPSQNSRVQADEPQANSDPLRKNLLRCLGGPWPDPCDLKPQVTRTEAKDGYQLIWVSYEVEPNDRVPAILIVPDGIDVRHPAPAVAVWHQHAGQWHLGKSEPAGLAGDPMHHTGIALAREGYVVLCPDALCFEERQDSDGMLKGGNYERFEFLRYTVAGKCMAWKNILDMRRAIDFLVSRPEVIRSKIGCYGHSMGSTHTWLVGPWEPRLKCLVGNCCLPTYAAIQRTKLLHCFPNFVPGFHAFGDTPDIVGLIAPRRLHLNLGTQDRGSPIQEALAGIETIEAAYKAAGVSEKFTHFVEDTGHVLSDAMWKEAKNVFADSFA